MDTHTVSASPHLTEHFFCSRGALCEHLAGNVAARLNAGLATRTRGSLVVSGGSTPIPLFRRLRTLALPWSRIDITLADERWVPSDHKDSNERLVRQELLQQYARYARMTPLKTRHATPEEAVDVCEARLQRFTRPFDVVILGMGTDGHTASLFPHAPSLEADRAEDDRRLCTTGRPQSAPHPRISLTLAALLDARHLILHIEGKEKRQVYDRARQGVDTRAMPIRAVLNQQQVAVDVYWAP